jgi:two-component system alkaline phosphatase synthesis response regulator PhoP
MAQRILVVDDDKNIVRLVRSYLEQAGFSVLVAYEGETAMHTIRRELPDLVVLDLMLPGRDGWQIARWMREDKRLASIPILMLTARVEDSDKMQGFELGADDYVTKPFNPPEIVARARAILRRASGAITPSSVLQSGELRLDTEQQTASLSGQPLDLTPTEFALLQVLMQNPNHAFTRTELIEKALGYAYEGMERTLDSHIKNLRKKIEKDPAQPEYIETVFGVGYRLREGREINS